MRIAYIRVSSLTQNEARQREALEKYGIEKWFTEKVSAKNMKRPELQRMLEFVREGDTVYILDFSRLARNTADLLQMVDFFSAKGVNLVSDKESLDTGTPTGKLMLTVIAGINEFERTNLLERQREGIAIAKREGKYRGGQPKKIDEAAFERNWVKYQRREINKTQFAAILNISRPTLDKLLKEREEIQG